MFHPIGSFFSREVRKFAGDENNLLTAARELTSESEPSFLHGTAHDRRHGQKRAGHDRDLHFRATNFSSSDKSESVARLMSKCSAKHFSAFARSDCRSCSLVATHRSSKRVVPARSSASTSPAPARSISRQMFTLVEMSTGTPHASPSTTAMPKFSW